MALTARDLFEAKVPAPPDTTPPANGSPRFDALVRRQVESLDWFKVPLRYLNLQALRGDPPTGLAATLGREPARVNAVLRGVAGHPRRARQRAPVGRRAPALGRQLARGARRQPPGARVRLRGDAHADRDPRLRPQPPGRGHGHAAGRRPADGRSAPGGTGSRCASPRASRCTGSSTSPTRRRSRSAPGGRRARRLGRRGRPGTRLGRPASLLHDTGRPEGGRDSRVGSALEAAGLVEHRQERGGPASVCGRWSATSSARAATSPRS